MFSTKGLGVMEAAVEDLWVEHSEEDPAYPVVRGVYLGMDCLDNYSL